MKLLRRGEPEEALRQLRRVRAWGRARGAPEKHWAWTTGFEREALTSLGRGEAAWRLVVRYLRDSYPRLAGASVAQRAHRLPEFVRYWEMPAAYWSGRFEHATLAMEAYLDACLAGSRACRAEDAYDMRMSVYNGDEQPTHVVRVTLFHLYRQQGRALGDWPRWQDWLNRLHSKLFKLANIAREDLARNPSLMPAFHARLRDLERERRPSHVTFGQKDLLEPKRKVLARHRQLQKRHRSVEIEARSAELKAKRAKYFPWLEVER